MKNKFSKFINLQGKYLTSLLFVLFFAVGQMWADDIFSWTVSSQLAKNSSDDATGGTTACTGANMGSKFTPTGGPDYYKFGQSTVLTFTLSTGNFAAGDEISFTFTNTSSGTKNVGVIIQETNPKTELITGVAKGDPEVQTYTVVANDGIAGANKFSVMRGGSDASNFAIRSVIVTRSSAGGGGDNDPVSSVSVSGATVGYATIPVTLTATPDEDATAFKWFVNGTEQEGATNATFNFSTATLGTYNIVAKARNDYNETNEWIASAAHSITVNKLCGNLITFNNFQANTNSNPAAVSIAASATNGVIGGTGHQKTRNGAENGGYRFSANDMYLGLSLANGSIATGDELVINVITEGTGKVSLYSSLSGEMLQQETYTGTGEKRFALNSSFNGATSVYMYRKSDANEGNGTFSSIALERSCVESSDCEIKSLTINGETVTANQGVYSYEVPSSVNLANVAVVYTIHHKATGSPASGFNVTVPAAGNPANTQTITVTAEDNTQATYTVSVTKAAAASDVVTLDELAVTGYTLDPAFDAGTLAYAITKGYGTADPAKELVTFTKSEEAQTVVVAYDSENHKFTVTVKAEDNTTTQDYVITINEAVAKRDLLEVLFSNGAKGAINAGSKEIRVPYIGADAPTFVSAAFASWVEDGATAAMNEGKLKVTGADGLFDEYTITPVQLDATGVALGEDITFDAVPAYIFAPYGWDSSKGVKFAKNYEQESNRRISSGNSRIYIAVPAGVATLQLTSGSQGNRNVVIKVNGETSTITKTAASNSAIELAMNPAIVNFVYIENNTGSGGGDAGFIKMHLVPAYSVTYDAGEGAVKSGEAMPTQVAVKAGTEITLAVGDALEKEGYDFDGWLCNIDAVKYAAGVAYTMTAAPTMFTAQWVEHIVPVDPTLTYNDGAYTTGLAALDLSTLIDEKQSTGAITYSVKEANGTGAAIDGVNFTATAAGTAVITASQAAVVGFNAKSVDFNVVVTEPSEVDGIKMVVAGALTGNFVSARTLNNGTNVVEGITYTKYITMSSTMSSFGNEVAPSATKGIYYYPSHKNIRFYFYVYNNQSSAKKIYIYTVDEDAEGTSDATSANVSVEAGRHMVYADVELTKHAAVVIGVENTGMQICQIVAVESGAALLQGGEAGYSIDYNKCYISPKKNTVAVYDGIEYYLYDDAKLVSASNVQLYTLGTHYIKFHLDAPKQVKVYADNKKYYIGSECSTEDAAKLYEATGNGDFTLAAGDWYINGSGAQVKINKLEFALPKAETPTITTQPATKLTFDPGDMTATVVATVTEGTLHYQWYKKATVGDDEEVGTDAATLTTTTEGTYYVVVTNTLAGHQDVSVTSEEAELGYRVTNDATLMALSASAGTLDPVFDKNEENYSVNLAMGTTVVPTLTATATMNGYANVAKNEATEFVNYEAVSTVVVTSEDGTATKTYTVHFYVDHLLDQVPVSATTIWDWTYAAEGTVTIKVTDSTEPIKKNEEGLMANVRVDNNKPTNDATFNSQALLFYGENVRAKDGGRWYASVGHIKFTTTVAGMVEVEYSDNGTNNRRVKINNALSESSASKTDVKIFAAYMPAGEITIMGVNENDTEENKYVRISKIRFVETADAEPSLARTDDWLAPGELGTICIPQGAVAVGADIYELVGKEPQYGKIVFESVEHMKPGKPYLFQAKGTRIDFILTDETLATEPDNSGAMKGTFVDMDLTELENVYYFADHALWSCDDLTSLSVPANRAYVKMNEVDPISSPSAAPGRHRVVLGVHGEQVVTGVENLNASEQPIKLLINGQIFILRGEKLFDVTGKLVK